MVSSAKSSPRTSIGPVIPRDLVDFVYLEKKVAAKLGLSWREYFYVRKEAIPGMNQDVSIVGRHTVLTEEGLARVLDYLRATTNSALPDNFDDCRRDLPSAVSKKNGVAVPGGAIELVVTHIFPNPRLLEAFDPSADPAARKKIRVSVPSNANFVPKMKLLAVRIDDHRYRLEGRCPRFRGRY